MHQGQNKKGPVFARTYTRPRFGLLSPPARPTKPGPEKPPISYLSLRITVLVGLIVAAQFWTQHHFGFSLIDQVLGLAIFTTFVPLFMKSMTFVRKKDDKSLVILFRQFLVFFLKTPLLIAATLLTLFVGFNFTTVQVVYSSGKPTLPVRLKSSGKLSLFDLKRFELPVPSGNVLRFVCSSGILGRSYILHAAGFQPRMVHVVPFVSSRVDVSNDLEPAPTVLVRLSAQDSGHRNLGVIEVYRIDPSETSELIGNCNLQGGITAAALFGPKRPIPEDWSRIWVLDALYSDWPMLKNNAADKELYRIRAGLIWSRPRSGELLNNQYLESGRTYEIVYKDINQTVRARKKVDLENQPLTDILIRIPKGPTS